MSEREKRGDTTSAVWVSDSLESQNNFVVLIMPRCMKDELFSILVMDSF